MEKLGELTHQWRYLVIAIEVAVAAGCCFFGFRVLAHGTAGGSTGAQVQVRRAPATPPDLGSTLAMPWQQSTSVSAAPKPAVGSALGAPAIPADRFARINHDDFELYRRQWQVLQMLMDGVRTYLEQRVVPRLMSR